ncbi:MAG: right-handed parallel beta-helix repeat-containing protein [Phycisphaerales bacterium]
MSTNIRVATPIHAVIFSLAFGGAGIAAADTFEVPGDFPTVPAALAASSSGDEIVVGPGTWLGRLDFSGKDVVVRSLAGPAVTILRPMSQGDVQEVVSFDAGETRAAVLEGFTVTGGLGRGNENGRRGGGIFVQDASPTIRDCWIVGNGPVGSPATFINGGGVFASNSEALIIDCTIGDNSAMGDCGGSGGGLELLGGSVDVINCRITGNIAGGGSCAGGGSAQGAGILIQTGRIINCIIANNHGSGFGSKAGFASGGIEIVGGDPVLILGSTIANNSASAFPLGDPKPSAGAGIFSFNGTNATISGVIVVGHELPGVSGTLGSVTDSVLDAPYAGAGNIVATPTFIGPDDYRLAAGSPGLDMGSAAAFMDAGIGTDIGGLPRFVDAVSGGPGLPGAGAHERQGCGGDVDGDGLIGIGDVLSVLAAWGPCDGCPADLDGDGDGDVGLLDLLSVLAGWGDAC